MIFRQKKIKKKQKLIENFNAIFFFGGFCSTITTPLCIIPNAKCHPEHCASPYALASKNDSGSHHSSTKPLIPGFPIRSSSSSSQAPPAVDCFAGPPIAPTLKSFTHVENTKKNCIKELLPKTENQFSSCALSQEEVDLQEFHVGAKDLVTL